MKISNSKKQLAKIISENRGWPDEAEWAAQDKLGLDEEGDEVGFYVERPASPSGADMWNAKMPRSTVVAHFKSNGLLKNWHQTILSRDEYFHLYPAPDADGWIEWEGGERPVDGQTMIDVKFRYGACATSVADCFNFTHDDHKASDIIAYRLHKPEQAKSTAVGDDETNLAAKEELEALEFQPSPTIEQLAADYRAKMAIAQQAQEEADSHRCGAESALERLIAAGKALGLVLSVAELEPELVITDWRDLRVGDVVEGRHCHRTVIGTVCEIDKECRDDRPFRIHEDGGNPWWVTSKEFKFIRRP